MKRTPLKPRKTPLKRTTAPGSRARANGVGVPQRMRKCENCGCDFYDSQRLGQTQRYCSMACFAEVTHGHAVDSYPPYEELHAAYVGADLSLRAVGARYGHTYTWAQKALLARGIPTRSRWDVSRRKPLALRKPRARWGVHLKPSDFCRHCGTTSAQLHLHHVVPRSKCPSARWDLRNGLQLCGSCHGGWHSGYDVIYRDVLTSEEWAYVSSLGFDAWLDRHYPPRPRDGTLLSGTCVRGHALTADNVSLVTGKRRCRLCANQRQAEYRRVTNTREVA